MSDKLATMTTAELMIAYRRIQTKRGTQFRESYLALEAYHEEARRRDAEIAALRAAAIPALEWIDEIYPPDIFDGSSGDEGPVQIVEIRENLRRATRSDDGRRNNGGHAGTGPKPKSFTLKLGDAFFMGLTTAEGQAVSPGVVLTVTAITRTHLTLTDIHNGDNYELIR